MNGSVAQAIQDQIPHNHCYGCGPENESGLQIKSFWDGENSICTYVPRPEQCAGPTRYVYGGTIASLIDCHSVCTSMAAFYDRDGRSIGEGPLIWCVTGRLTVNYRSPTPIDRPIELLAKIAEIGEKKALVSCVLSSGGEVTADAEVIAVRVPGAWGRD